MLPTELIIYMVAKEFGVPPWTLYDVDAADIMSAYVIMCELQPRQKGGRGGGSIR